MKLISHAVAILCAASLCNVTLAADTIKIGMPIGLSGANSVVAPSVVQSAELAVEEINRDGGIWGRQVELLVADDGSGAVGAQKAFNSLVFDKGVDVLISMETSAARNAALPIVSRGKVPYIYTSSYEGHSCSPWMYANGWVPEQISAAIVDYLISANQAKSFFLIGSDYAFGRGVLQYTRDYIEKNGGKVVGEEYLPMDGSDWTAILAKVRQTQPNALISCTAGGAPNVSLGKQIKSAGIDLPYGNIALDEGTAKDMGAAAAGEIIAGSYMTAINTPENKRYLQALKDKFGDDLKTPNDLSVPQYEAIYAYKAAVEKAGSTNSRDVIKALGEVSVTGPRGVIRMDPVSRHTDLNMYLAKVLDDGSVQIVKTFNNVSTGKQCSFKP